MKELTNEEKAKRYDEAIERANELSYVSDKNSLQRKTVEHIFPELAESEDEKIRKSIIAIINNYVDNSNTFKPKMIAWLEKQAEKNPAEWHREDEQNLNACLGYIPDEFLRRWLIDTIHVKYDKPADKVKPKFKVGDWIIFNGLTLYVKEVVKGFYRTISKDGITNSYDWGIDNVARLWTIQDAKDGDVLFYDSICGFTFIYNGINPEGALLYSYVESNDGSPLLKYNIGKPNVGIGYATDKNIYPATKEQRDLLFQKMKEAGYKGINKMFDR